MLPGDRQHLIIKYYVLMKRLNWSLWVKSAKNHFKIKLNKCLIKQNKGSMNFFKNRIVSIALLLGFCICGAANSFAQTTTGDSLSKFRLSVSERFRIETWDNSVSLSKAAKAGTSYLRTRTSAMGEWMPDESIDFALKLTNEFRTYYAPSTNNFHLNEVFIDQLYVKWNTNSFLTGALTLGRQNISFGEGFIVMDGTPLDGSRSTYFNAARYDWNINKSNSITIFGTYMPKQDNLLPVLNGNDIDPAYEGDGTYCLSEQNETGGGIYYTGKYEKMNLQSYYILKSDIKPDKSIGQVRSDVHTVGSRLNTGLCKYVSTTFEGAYQFGTYGDNRRNAYGGYWYFDLRPAWELSILPKTFTVGTICLSGDKTGTKEMEGWDPVFSRWPKWSESYVYTLIKEYNGKVSYWSNIISFYTSIKFTFSENINFNIDYHHMLAPQETMASGYLSGNGNVRGDLIIAKVVYDISKNVSGHFIWEHFIPGNYYVRGADPYTWSRMEISFKF
jgi:hypothetical protein